MKCYSYSCARCGFLAKASGGVDHAKGCFTVTIHCRDCRKLYDVATHVRLSAALALKTGSGLGAEQTRFPRKLNRSELGLMLPDHVFVTQTIVSTRPSLPSGFLLARQDLRWVQLATQCPVATHHKVEEWTHPGRCPRCETFLERSALPYRVVD